MHRFFHVFVLSLLALSLSPAGQAARDLDTLPRGGSALQFVVIEAEGCIYCHLFRRDVLPSYLSSPRAQQVPIRFLDVNEAEAEGGVGLSSPIDVVPTVVLLKENKEVGRIPGYLGPESFFHSVSYLLRRVD